MRLRNLAHQTLERISSAPVPPSLNNTNQAEQGTLDRTKVIVQCSASRELNTEHAFLHESSISHAILASQSTAYDDAFVRLSLHLPSGIPARRWRLFLSDATRFLNRWGPAAEGLGWTADDLFGLHPTAPMARYDCMGMLWMLRGHRVTALTDKLARISDGLTFYRRPSKFLAAQRLQLLELPDALGVGNRFDG
jgi:hypothetical protein